jgi:hypothetical protein
MADQFLVYQLDWRHTRIAGAALDNYDKLTFEFNGWVSRTQPVLTRRWQRDEGSFSIAVVGC